MQNLLKITFDYGRNFNTEQQADLAKAAGVDLEFYDDGGIKGHALMTFAEAMPFAPFTVQEVMPYQRCPIPATASVADKWNGQIAESI